jgi:two-component system NtrC family sensor kinase
MNVILNARDAMAGGGVVTLTTRGDAGYLSITCEDTGRGIAEDDLSRIFDAFYTTKDHGLGAGLGLYICQSIVDEHGGHVQIDSRVGKGTKVTITLPAERRPTRGDETMPAGEIEVIGGPVIRRTVNHIGGNR